MLRKLFRFHGQKGVRRVQKYGSSFREQYMSLKVAHSDRRKEPRLAVIVSKKVSKKAVVRNRIRRRVFETFRKHWQNIPQKTDMVLSVYDEKVATMSSEDLERTILRLIKKSFHSNP